MIKNIPNGVYPTMVTPFTDDNKIDYNGVLQIMEWYSQNGVDGIFAICQSSEIFFLSFEERLELLRFIMKNKPAEMSVVASGHTADDISVGFTFHPNPEENTSQRVSISVYPQPGEDATATEVAEYVLKQGSEILALQKIYGDLYYDQYPV